MKHSILVTSLLLSVSAFACGSAVNPGAADEATDGTAAGPQWLPAVEVGDGGASASDDTDSGEIVSGEAEVQSTSEGLSVSGWTVQLPNNTTTPGSTDKQPWYYTSGSSKIYADPTTGTTTKGSKHCRTEMRENTTWKASGTNSITVTGMVTKGSGGITIGQVFNSDDSITLAELEYTGSGFEVFYEEAKSEGGSHPISGSTGLNKSYTYTMSLTKGVLTVKIAGGGSWSTKPSSKVSGNKFYFKVGNYDQKSTGTPTTKVSSTIHSVVEVSSLSVSHS